MTNNLAELVRGRKLLEDATDAEIELLLSMLDENTPPQPYKPDWMSEARWGQVLSVAIEAGRSRILARDAAKQAAALTAKRESTLVEAERIVNGERAADYGDSTTNLTRIAGIAELLLDDSEWEHLTEKREFSATMIAKVLIAVKLGRERHQHKRDNLVDAAGYIELLDRCYQ